MFYLFWRDPKLLEQMLGLGLAALGPALEEDAQPVARRAAEALSLGENDQPPERDEIAFDMIMTFSERDSLRAMARQPDVIIPLERSRQRKRPAALVLLCDVSGSMTGYSRMRIHFARALTNCRHRVHTFVFGTRLTNVTRDLRHRDVDKDLGLVARHVEYWSGGTRIGACLNDFNRFRGRRVPGQGAVVFLVTAGPDRDADGGPGHEVSLLQRSCRKLIWLNPLLRWHGFEPRSWGIRMMLPHVDAFRTCHNVTVLRTCRGARRSRSAGRQGDETMAEGSLNEDVLEMAEGWATSGHKVALATVTHTWGSSPRPVGSQLAVREDGTFRGSVSGGCIEGAVIGEAQAAIADGAVRNLEFSVSNERAWEVGLTCGGTVHVFVAPLT